MNLASKSWPAGVWRALGLAAAVVLVGKADIARFDDDDEDPVASQRHNLPFSRKPLGVGSSPQQHRSCR
jgi:hypothetical protein